MKKSSNYWLRRSVLRRKYPLGTEVIITRRTKFYGKQGEVADYEPDPLGDLIGVRVENQLNFYSEDDFIVLFPKSIP